MSGATLEAVLCIDEDAFDQFGRPKFTKRLRIQRERSLWLTILRYVDDVFVATRWLCPGCVEHIISVIYSRTVVFESANDGKGTVNGFNAVRVLDLWCFMNWKTALFTLV